MTRSSAGFGERQSQSWTFGRSGTGDKHLLSVLGRERNEGKQKEAVGSEVFLFFFYVWVNLQDFQPGAKRKHEQLFLTGVRLTNDPGLSYSPRLCSLRSWVLLFGTDLGQKKNKTKHITKHTQKTQPLLRDAWARQSLQGRGEPGQLARVLLQAHSKEFGACEEDLYHGRKNTVWRATCQDQWRDGTFFSPSLSPSALSCWRGIWDAVSKGRLEERFFQDHIMLENLGGLHHSSFKGSF